jgi:hypothetical protein
VITDKAYAAVNDANSEVAWFTLLTITSKGVSSYLCDNTDTITSRGQAYLPFPFKITLPESDGETLPKVKYTIANVDQSLVEAIRAEITPPTIKLEVVTTINLDAPEIIIDGLVMHDASYDAVQISGTLSIPNILSRKFGETYSPSIFPALFA